MARIDVSHGLHVAFLQVVALCFLKATTLVDFLATFMFQVAVSQSYMELAISKVDTFIVLTLLFSNALKVSWCIMYSGYGK